MFHITAHFVRERYLNELGRHNYVTPTSYLELINSFKNLLQKKQDETMKAKRRYVVGLDKLAFAASQVGGVLAVSPAHTCLLIPFGPILYT